MVTNTVGVLGEEELEQEAREVFEEEPEEVNRALTELQTWLAETPHLTKVRTDTFSLWHFYRGCHHDMEKTKTKLDLHFTMRGLVPEWWAGWDPRQEQLEKIIHAGIFLPLRGFDRQGRYVLLIRVGQVDPSIMSTDDCYKTMIMIFSLAQEHNKQYWTKGYVLIIDEEGAGMRHAMMTGPEVMKKHKLVFQDCYPMESQILIDNSKQLILNLPSVFQAVLSAMLAMMDQKFQNMVKVLPNRGLTDSMKDLMGEAVLPAEYGGTNGTVDEHRCFWKEEVRKHRDWLMKQEKFRTEESLRPDKPKMISDLVGSSCSIM